LSPVRLLRENPGFARLWAAEVVSLLGDWFTIIALAVLVSRGTGGSGLAIGGLLLTQLLPAVVFAPWAGVVVDRFDRRRLLIGSDAIRAVLVLAFIPAAAAGRSEWLYILAFLHFSVASVFEPGRAALMPALLAPADLVAGSTLSTVTWSVMAALGGLAGGTFLTLLGLRAAFVLDSLTFIASAALIASIPRASAARPGRHGGGEPVRFLAAVRYLIAHPVTGATLLVKAINGLAVVDTFIVIYGTRLFARGESGALSVGLLYASFGLGALLAPTLLNLGNDGTPARMRRFIALGTGFLVAGLLVLSRAPGLGVACLAILLRGMGGSTNWTFSTIILQQVVPDGMLGRVFALDFACAQLAAVSCALTWGVLMDQFGARPVVFLAGCLALLPCAAWTLSLSRMDQREPAVH
jgi:MFS family permease